MSKFLQLFSLVIILLSCETKKEFTVSVQSQNAEIDTLYITELITEKILAKVPLQGKEFNFKIESPTIGAISANKGEDSYLVVLKPGEKVNLSIDSMSIKTTNDVADSLMNYLWKSNNAFIAENSSVIFNTDNPKEVISIFDSLHMKREDIINSNKEELSKEEFEILNHQNEARIHSFLFYYGRLVKGFFPNNSFFNFIHDIDNNTIWAKTLPHNLLYKYEVQYLNEKDSLTNIDSFLSFIEAQTKNKDLAEFLKSVYLAEVIQHPSYWAKHEQLFNSEALQQVLEKEESNKYYSLIKKSSDSFFSSQKGVKAFDFTATSLNGKEIKLSDFNGKLVFIDAWASWCGPCIAHRPKVIKLAEKYKDNPNVAFLMISVDSSKDKWKRFVARRGEENYGYELIIENGMSTEFGDNYLVKMIPKYILIDKNGIIINSDISEPSIAVEEQIAQELKIM